MVNNQKPTAPGKGYTDGIKSFYSKEEIIELLIAATRKSLDEKDPLEGRAYLVLKEMPDAKIGTVLRPVINWDTGELSETTFGQDQYCYASKYAGRQSFLIRRLYITNLTGLSESID